MSISFFLVLTVLSSGFTWQGERPTRKGELLVATASIPDPRFAEAVILIVEDNERGTVGLVVNRPAGEVPRVDVFAQLGIPSEQTGSLTVFEGGPVFPDQLFALHTSDLMLPESKLVGEGIAMTEATALMETVAKGQVPTNFKLILGYSGWGQGQLDLEMTTGSWMLVPGRASLVFSNDPARLWQSIKDEFTMRL